MSNAPGTFAYPGSKTHYDTWIIDHIPEHTQYIEPLGGAASVLVAKPASEMEVYNDINGDCVDFFRAVRDRPDELKRWVKYTPFSRKLYNKYLDSYPNWPDDLVERAGRFLFVQTASFGGKGLTVDSPTFSVCKSDSGKPSADNTSWSDKPSHIDRLANRFNSVDIECLDYADLVDKYDHPDAFFYFDPPYIDVGDEYYQTESGGFDHRRFVDVLESMNAKWLVSYDQNLPPVLKDHYTISRTKVAGMSAQNPEKVETLTMNYKPDQTAMFSKAQQATLSESTVEPETQEGVSD